MTRSDNNIIKFLDFAGFCIEVLQLCNEFLSFIVVVNVVRDRLKLDVLCDRNLGKTSQKVIPDVVSRQVRRHWVFIEMLLKRVVWVLETFLRRICPQVLICRGNRLTVCIKFFPSKVVPLPAAFRLFVDTDDLKAILP